MSNNDYKNLLKEKGIKVTNQRLLVLEAMALSEGKHLTVEEIYDIVRENYPEIGLATVYRTVQLLLELELVDKVNINDGFVRYEISKDRDETGHHHHHLVCMECGKVYSFEDDLLEKLEEHIMEKTGFEVIDHDLKLYGYCSLCKENRK